MSRILTSVLTLSWAAIFGLLSLSVVPGGGPQGLAVLDLLGLNIMPLAEATANPVVGYLLALFDLSASVLLFWAFAVSLSPHVRDIDAGDDINRVAFAAGAGALVLGLVAGALLLVPGLFTVAMVSLAALVMSYIATFLERLSLLMSSQPGAGDIRAAARLMAMGAAHNSMLSRISGRASSHSKDDPK